MNIDKAQASIITDRCIPPSGLGPSPSTIKSVLLILRGLGAPGKDISVPASVIELRTCLGERAVRGAMSCLREHGIITQTESPAPGRPAQYRMNYLVLADWLCDGDWEAVRSLSSRSNGGTLRRRSQAPCAAEHRHDAPPSKSTPARDTETAASDAGTPAHNAADIKEETAVPAFSSSSSTGMTFGQANRKLAAAAVGVVEGIEDWAKVAKSAGIASDLAVQLATVVVQVGVTSREFGLNALERIQERLAGGRVTNPSGLLKTLLEQPGGSEPSKKSIARKRALENRRENFRKYARDCPAHEMRMTADRVRVIIERDLGAEVAELLIPIGHFQLELSEWDQMIDFIAPRWSEIKSMQLLGVA